MSEQEPETLTLEVGEHGRVSALLINPPGSIACYVFAHGAGAGMQHSSMSVIANELAERHVATLRYQFPYMEKGSKRTDSPEVCHATVRAAVAVAGERLPRLPLVAGGRSFGGRMTSQAQALEPLPRVRGLALIGFPLHPAKQPGIARAEHLDRVQIPLLFLQGSRDALAEPTLLKQVTHRLGALATLHFIEGADHSLHVPARSGRTDAEVRAEALQEMLRWLAGLAR